MKQMSLLPTHEALAEIQWVIVRGFIGTFLDLSAPLSHMAPSGTGAVEQTVLTSLPTKHRVGGGKV